MLNISERPIGDMGRTMQLKSLKEVKERSKSATQRWVVIALAVIVIVILFLPWTQTVPGAGKVTTLKPGQRPQALQSAIAGRIERWYVKEGDLVEKGDTLLFISEIKSEYFDPSLLERTELQVRAKGLSVESYKEKVLALDKRIAALTNNRKLKLEQARNYIKQAKLKIESDSIDLEAARTNFNIAQQQFDRQQKLYDEGLKSLTDLEKRRMKLQETQAKLISSQNKLLTSRNQLLNYEVGLTSTEAEYNEKIAKAKSEKFETMSGQFDAEAAKTKLQNAYSNYEVRQGLYYIRAPQSGYITQARKTGIGETIKEGEEILSIMPADYEIGVEIYVAPQDLPLVSKGTKVRLIFDGWPAMVFSGWPGVSLGTFGGRVVAVDKFTSPNSKFRMLVAPDSSSAPWPDALQVGSGARGVALLSNVPIWYEVWRQLSGFPPEYYDAQKNGYKVAPKKKPKAK